MSSILALRSNLPRGQAERLLSPTSLRGVVRRLTLGRLRAVAEVYVPFRLHQVEIENRGRRQSRFYAVDALDGSLDLYGFDAAPTGSELGAVETRNCPVPRLHADRSRQILTDKLRRLLFAAGLFRLRDLHIAAGPPVMSVHIPYWLGLYGNDCDLRLLAIDAVRCRIEGARVSNLLYGWLQN